MRTCYCRLRLELLAAWTCAVKRIGARLVRLLLDALQPNYDQQQVTTTPSSINMTIDINISNWQYCIQFMYWTFCQLLPVLPVFPLSRQKYFLPCKNPTLHQTPLSNGWPQNALRYHQFTPISCHFQGCKLIKRFWSWLWLTQAALQQVPDL